MRPPTAGEAVRAGEDALLTCVVLGKKRRPVLWRRAKDLQLLTAGSVRVTRDDRVYVLHDDGEYFGMFIYFYYNIFGPVDFLTSFTLQFCCFDVSVYININRFF